MTTAFTGINMAAFNRKQLTSVARILQVPYHNLTTSAALITAIKAK